MSSGLPVPQAYNYECGNSPSSAALCANQNEAQVQTQTNSMATGGSRRKRGGNSGSIAVQMPQNDLADTSPQNSGNNTLQSYETISQSGANSAYDECAINPNTPLCQASTVNQQNGGKHKHHKKSHKKSHKKHKAHKKGGKKSRKNHKKSKSHSNKKRTKKGGSCTCPPCSFYKGKADFCCGMRC